MPSVLQEGGLLGESRAMRELGQLLARIAHSDATVLVTGESGTGKELVARVIHRKSPRSAGPFIAVNCAAIPDTLLESELFGHVRGAFTHASVDRRGLFEEASGGTLLLDEVGELTRPIQAKLLRALQERRVRPVGASEERAVDIRLVAATNRRLEDLVAEKRFREDLYYRLNVIGVSLPPLRHRGDDVLVLARHFADILATNGTPKVIGPGAAEVLRSHDWPGNVRELYNCMMHAVTVSNAPTIEADALPPSVRASASIPASLPPLAEATEALPQLDELERRYIRHVLDRTGYNKTEAARVLGIDPRTLRRKLCRDR